MFVTAAQQENMCSMVTQYKSKSINSIDIAFSDRTIANMYERRGKLLGRKKKKKNKNKK